MRKKTNKETEIDWLDLKERLRRQSEVFGLHTGTNSLQEQWMRLFSFFQHSTEGMLLLDEEGKVLMANRECQRIFGLKQAELLASDLYSLLPLAQAVPREPKSWLKAAADKGLYTMGDSIRNRKSFSIREVGVEVNGVGRLIQVYIKEVTELVRQAEYEAEQTAMFIQMLSHAPEPMLLLDASLTIFEFNQAAARMMHGITGKFMKKGQSYLDFVTPGRAKEKGWEIFREVLSGLVVERMMELPSPMGGSPVFWMLTYQPLYDAYGDIAGVLISGADLTRERAWRKQLHEQAERLSWWEMHSQEALWVVDGQWKIRYAGGPAAAWLGLTSSRLEGSSLRKFLPARSTYLADLQAWIAAGEATPFEAIWQLEAAPKAGVRLRVNARRHAAMDATEGHVVIRLALQAPFDRLAAQEEAFQALKALNAHRQVKWYLLFDEADKLLNPTDWPPPGLSWEGKESPDLVAVLRALGKQPAVFFKNWQAAGGEPLVFDARHGVEEAQWHFFERTHAAGLKLKLLVLTETLSRQRLPALEKELTRLRTQLQKLQQTNSNWQKAFDLLRGVFTQVSWEYDVDQQLFKWLTAGQEVFFGHEIPYLSLHQLHHYLHPADAKAFSGHLLDEQLLGADGWLRVRNANDDFDQWHYRILPVADVKYRKGIWYRPLDHSFNLSLEHFLGFSRFLDDIGWGALVLNAHMRLEHASALACDWLALPPDWSMQRFDEITCVQQTRLAAEACSLRPPGSLFQFEYFNAYTQRWMFVWIYTTQNMRAVYLQLLKS